MSVDKTFHESIDNLDGGQPQKAIYRSSLTRFCKIKAHENTSELEDRRIGDSSMNCDLDIPTANQETVKSREWAERKPPPGSYVFEVCRESIVNIPEDNVAPETSDDAFCLRTIRMKVMILS